MTSPLNVPDQTQPAREATPTVQFRADFSDQTGVFDPSSFVETMHVIGLGGIGASALPTFACMGAKKYVLWDKDVVEPRNVASQLLYKPSDLYRPKTEVCEEYLRAYGVPDIEVEIRPRFFTKDDAVEGVVISGVDSMSARQEIWAAIKANVNAVPFYLDGRIGGLNMSLLAVEPFDADWYEERWLFDDDAAAPLPCTERAIAYPAVVLGGIMASYLAEWHAGHLLPKRVDFNLRDMFFQTVGSRK